MMTYSSRFIPLEAITPRRKQPLIYNQLGKGSTFNARQAGDFFPSLVNRELIVKFVVFSVFWLQFKHSSYILSSLLPFLKFNCLVGFFFASRSSSNWSNFSSFLEFAFHARVQELSSHGEDTYMSMAPRWVNTVVQKQLAMDWCGNYNGVWWSVVDNWYHAWSR